MILCFGLKTSVFGNKSLQDYIYGLHMLHCPEKAKDSLLLLKRAVRGLVFGAVTLRVQRT